MLARHLHGAIVISGANRLASGRFAEDHLGATVHVLDDGFQHFKLDRDADIVLVNRADLEHPRTLPWGRLREPPDVLVAADAIVSLDPTLSINAPHAVVFQSRRVVAPAVFEGGSVRPGSRVLAVAGIAEPEPFFASLTHAGWELAGTRTFA